MAEDRVLKSAASRANRPERTPVGKARRDVLTVKQDDDPEFVRRIVNDKPGRIQKFLEAGYEIVDKPVQVGDPRVGTATPEGSPVKIHVGGGQQAYLMRQKREYYEEDQRTKAQELSDLEDQMRNSDKADGRYGKVELFRTP
jgi:hypothetical protein